MVKLLLGNDCKAGLRAVLLASAWLQAAVAFGQPPSAAMSFALSPIGEGTISALTITLINEDPTAPASDLAVTLDLAAGLRIATPSNASTDCVNGVLAATEGGMTIVLSDARLGTSSTCTVEVDVTGDTAGVYVNVSGDVTSSAGNGGSANAELTISATLPTLAMSFAPASVPLGGTSTITYALENPPGGVSQQSFAFRNVLPAGMVVADPPNVSTTCDTTFGLPLAARPGDTELDFFLNAFLGFAPGTSCETRVDVTASVLGTVGNTTEALLLSSGELSGKAGAVLDVTAEALNLAGFFSGDPVPPGFPLSLDFTIDNFNRDFEATDIAFSNDLNATLAGLVAVGLPVNDVCGAGSTLSGTNNISLSGGSLLPGGTCSFSVEVQVPGSAAAGEYTNTSSEVTAQIDGRSVTGSAAMDAFEVSEAPVLEKRFITNPLPTGLQLMMELTITNFSTTNAANDIGFVDNLEAFIPGLTAVSLPTDFCGAGSTLTFIDDDFTRSLAMNGGTLAPSSSCTFQVDFEVPLSVASGRYMNRTEPITAMVDGTAVTGRSAEAELEVVGAPQLRKSFDQTTVAPGDSVTLEFELNLDENAPGDATAISFQDDLDAMLTGLEATGLPLVDVCGSGSRLEGTSLLTFSGGTLAPLGQCTFSVTLDVPATAPSQSYPNVTSEVSATVGGTSLLGAPAVAELQVSSIAFEKEFLTDPSFAGDTVPLRFTITNQSADEPATAMLFTDNLNDVLPGLVATGLPLNDVCGTGSIISGTNLLIFTGGNVLAGESCSFDVDAQIPSDAQADSYGNVTSALSFTSGAAPGSVSGASDVLNIAEALSFAKAFDADVVAPGDTVNLEFTITNAHPTLTAEELSFDDDLSAALPGLGVLGLPVGDVCGAGSILTVVDDNVLRLTDGVVASGSSCTFSVELQVPDDVRMGSSVANETSELTGTLDGVARSAPPARDTLEVNLISFTKQFDGPAEQGGSTMLTFTIENLNAASTATGVSFSDDLDAVLPGLVAAGTPVEDVCGEGSRLDGTGALALRDGNVEAGASCSFSVAVDVPLAATPGEYQNVTSTVSTDQGVVGDPASATLTVLPRSVEDGGVDGGPSGGGGGGGCECRTTTGKDVPLWLLAGLLLVLWRRPGRAR